ncbi:MAG: ferredoxin:thioredoxin reductase [Methanomicrobiaceae archaeon]|nr:ferredoxin:thioredoxin reductase [Methanomicrobiaceae archaeon]
MSKKEIPKEEFEELSEEIIGWAESYAEENDYKLNEDERQRNAVLKGLARNKIKFGERYCPCRIRSGDKEKDKEIICPCIFHRDEIEKEGNCHCYLFYAKD